MSDDAHLHCAFAGTPLGDPIELGAAAAVMAADDAIPSPVSLLAAKSWCGHSEPAAGVLGLAHAHLALSQQAALPVLHLRSLNPHIASAFSSQASDMRKMVTARQTAPMAGVQAGAQLYSGTSAFAFQGTNAHAIMSVQSPGAASQSEMVEAKSLPFQRRRHWVAPLTHPVLTQFKDNKSSVIILEANLAVPSAAYLWDHVVADRSLMPGAGSFDLACSSAKLLCATSGQTTTVLTDATLPAPLLLPQQTANPGAAIVQVSVNSLGGQVRVATGTPQQTHLVGYLSQVQGSTVSKERLQAHSSCLAEVLKQVWEVEIQTLGAPFGLLASRVEASVSSDLCPAQLDCAFQLGAVLTQGRAGCQKALRVPVGAQAIVVNPPEEDPSQQLVASAQTHDMHCMPADDSMLVDFAVGRLCQVFSLLAKPLQSGQAAKRAQQESAQDSMLYVMSRPAFEPRQQMAQAATQAARISLHGSNLFEVYAKAIALAKTAAGADADKRLGFSLQTAGALTTALTPQLAPSSSSANALLGLRALVKSLGHEYTTMQCQATDAHAAHTCSKTATVSLLSSAQQAQQASSEQAGIMHTSKLLPLAAASSPALSGPFQLVPSPRGSLGNLKPVTLPAMVPAAGQVVLEVHAVGVNFRDVLNVLGMYPGDPGPPGADCAGVVTAMGAGVQGLVQGWLPLLTVQESCCKSSKQLHEVCVAFAYQSSKQWGCWPCIHCMAGNCSQVAWLWSIWQG